MFTKKAQRNRNQNKSLGELSLTSNFGFNFNKSALDHILLWVNLRHVNIKCYYYYYYYYYYDQDSESLRKDKSFQGTKLS